MKEWMHGFNREKARKALVHLDRRFLTGAFAWEDTPEGYEYWREKFDINIDASAATRISQMIDEYDALMSETENTRMKMTDKFVSPAPLPTPYERELLTILMEECAEIQQRASKILRFGASEIQPEQGLTNVERMSLEIGDFEHIVYTLTELGLVCPTHVFQGIRNKKDQLAKYLQHDKEATND